MSTIKSIFIALSLFTSISPVLAADHGLIGRNLEKRFPKKGGSLFKEWEAMLENSINKSEVEKIEIVNAFFNTRIDYAEDSLIWHESDYWETLVDLFGTGFGDCEDFALAKMATLLELGISPLKLKLVYVRADLSVYGRTGTQAHMVLAYYSNPSSEPLIMDNMNPLLLNASKRRDLTPVFMFNHLGVWDSSGKSVTSKLNKWQDFLTRSSKDGIDFNSAAGHLNQR